MNGGDIKRRRRIVATALWVSVMFGFGASSSQAAECQTCDNAAAAGKPLALNQYTKRHVLGGKKTAYSLVRKPTKLNPKPGTRLSKRSADPALDAPPLIPQDLPEFVSNANAALTSGDLNSRPPVTAVAMADKIKLAPIEMVSGVQIASADQLNDIDRAFLATTSSAAATDLPSQQAQARDTGNLLSATYDDESWRRASLIGKILIAFGAMLTLGAMLRMMLTHRAHA